MPTENVTYSVQEAAELSGICRTNLYKLLKNGTLKSRKFGRKTLILKQDLESFLDTLPVYAAETQ